MCDGSAPPAVTHLCADCVFAFLYKRGHIVGHVVDFFPVVGPTRFQFIIHGRTVLSDALSVNEQIEYPKSGCVDFSRFHRAFCSESLAEKRDALFRTGLHGTSLFVSGVYAQHFAAFLRYHGTVAECHSGSFEIFGESYGTLRAVLFVVGGHFDVVIIRHLVHGQVVVGAEANQAVFQPAGRVGIGVHKCPVDIGLHSRAIHLEGQMVERAGEFGLSEKLA